MSKKVWGGRFQEKTDALVDRFNASIRFDFRLYPYDIKGSMAHCRMLAKQKVITDDEAAKIIKGLEEIRREFDEGKFPPLDDYEDVHSLVERLLIEKIGEVGEKLHTGRSRNDQVALDERLYVRDAVHRLVSLIKEMQIALVELADRNFDLIMPGYTHLQRAQPVLIAHHMLAYYEMMKRDRDRFEDVIKRINILPLGSAALAGTTFELDRKMVAKELGFDLISQNSMDAVSDRDFIIDFLYACSVLMMHLSRLSEEIILWSTQEFGFVAISDAFSTGSSIMPQKKNPDMPELVRGKSGRVYGHLFSLLSVMKGLPLSYNKDMQEDKEALFDTYDTVQICLEIMARLLGELSFQEDRLKIATEKGFLTATDMADYLVRKGISFRRAHEIVGNMVLFAMGQGKELHDLTLEEMKGFAIQIDKDVYEWLEPISSVKKRNIVGGTGPEMVRQSLNKAKEELGL